MPVTLIPDFSEPFLLEVAKGNVPGHSLIHKYGRMPSGTSGTEETISELGQMQFPASASTMRIKAGGNANDNSGGSGAREVTIYGLDETGALAEEAVASNGASASSSTTVTFLRTFRARVTKGGAYVTTGTGITGQNQASITIEKTAGSGDFLTIPQYECTTEYAGYHIPIGKTGYLLSALMQVDAAKSADIILYQRGDILDISAPVTPRRVMFYFDGVQGDSHFAPKSPVKINALTDVWWTFIPSANGTECSIDFEILLVDD